ncbi:MAG: ParB/RepB/Spo0J family partition protein [Candidatus Pacebacteria bacterium]|nr:ParB/RepB/Spo0J family partition protein [Candidatus Paceibacterota bacterium]
MLGKGLESLIPQKGNQGQDPGAGSNANANQNSQPRPLPQTQPQLQSQPQLQHQLHPQKKDELAQESIFHIELDKIEPNPDQPRRNFDQDALRELANSIREFGMLQPIVVSQVKRESSNGIDVEYQIIAGERRFMAAKLLGLPRVPAIVRNVNLEREKLELGVIENIQRENLNPIELARSFQRLQEEFRMTQREIAAKLGKSREVVANAVRLLDLPEDIQNALERGEVSESNARMLLAMEDPGAQRQLLREIIENKLTTRDVRERIQRMAFLGGSGANGGMPHGTGMGINNSESAGDAAPVARRGRPPLQEVRLAPEVKMMKDELSTELGAPVEIRKTAHNGSISITFFSEEELENILRKLGGNKE